MTCSASRMNLIRSFLLEQGGKLVLKLARFAAVGLGVYLAQHNIISQDSPLLNELTGAVLALIGIGWSIFREWIDHKYGYAAKPPAPTPPPPDITP